MTFGGVSFCQGLGSPLPFQLVIKNRSRLRITKREPQAFDGLDSVERKAMLDGKVVFDANGHGACLPRFRPTVLRHLTLSHRAVSARPS